MIRKTIMAICILMSITCAVLWPVSHWWNPSWYDTIKSRPLVGYWGGYALYDGDFFVAWESPYPPATPPKIFYGVPIDPNSIPDLLTDECDLTDAQIEEMKKAIFTTTTQSKVAFSVYDEKKINWALLGWKLDYDITFRKGSMNTPLPMLAALFAFISIMLGAYNPIVRRRRRKHNLCEQCRYNLTGNTSGVCPECGTKIQ